MCNLNEDAVVFVSPSLLLLKIVARDRTAEVISSAFFLSSFNFCFVGWRLLTTLAENGFILRLITWCTLMWIGLLMVCCTTVTSWADTWDDWCTCPSLGRIVTSAHPTVSLTARALMDAIERVRCCAGTCSG